MAIETTSQSGIWGRDLHCGEQGEAVESLLREDQWETVKILRVKRLQIYAAKEIGVVGRGVNSGKLLDLGDGIGLF
jgi:hypothetical protein